LNYPNYYPKNVDVLIDILTFIYFLIAIIFYENINYCFFLSSYFIWRILVICFFKLRLIVDIGIGEKAMVSFPRTLLATIINFIEIIIGFSYLNYFFTVTTLTNKFDIFIETLLAFTTMNFDLNYQCTAQKWIVIFEVFTFIIFIIFFIVNITNLKRKK
jgi:hypothetical protein